MKFNTVEFAYNDIGYNDAFSSVPAEFVSFTCIRVPLYRHIAYNDAFCRSKQSICSQGRLV